MTIAITNDSALISTTEYFLFGDSTTASYQTTDAILQVFLDLNALAAGDEFLIKFYEKADGSNARPFYKSTVIGAQSDLWVSPSFLVGNGYEVSIDRIAGTDRTIPWSLRLVT